ncbi:MAG TPA: hypothetical protein VFO67_19880 [Gemmatimonadales bacterium]|nr:hypothetical protein [Gemmatimonadales bacterium]
MPWFFVGTILLDIAAFATGVLLCYFGKDLLEKGITGSFSGEGQVSSTQFKVLTSSPGLVFALAGLIVIGTAIYRGNELTTQTTAPPSISDGRPDLDQLSSSMTIRMLKESPSVQFARARLEDARQWAKAGERASALLQLAQAIVVEPQLLRAALDSAELRAVMADEDFEELVRRRFALASSTPAESAAVVPRLEPTTGDLVGHLRLFALQRAANGLGFEDTASLVAKVPAGPGTERREATLSTLVELLGRNPNALVRLLEDDRYRWLRQDVAMMEGLRDRLAAVSAEVPTRSNVARSDPR